MAITKPCRPYTEYNLFFQLEREYILQVELGLQPDYEPTEVFDPSDASNYQGPPLPSRYSGLVLLSDWHLPGKEKRRKRRHRKTHGKIGFHELSLRIADAWKNVDAETRTFCAELCDIGLMQYKTAMRMYKAAYPEEDGETVKTAECMGGKKAPPAVDEFAFLFDETPSTSSRYIPTDRCTMAEVDAAFENDLALSLEDFNESLSDLSASSGSDSSLRDSLAGSMVDIEDDEIINMWKSEPEVIGSTPDAGAFSAFICPSSSGTVVTNSSRSYASSRVASRDGSYCQFIPQEPPLRRHDTTSSSFDPYGHNSHIDATLNDLKNMRKILLSQQIQMQSSILAARRLTEEQKKRHHGRGQSRRRSFAACSA
eukprot:CCRYP_001546-RA/>CCRYP_001546-RA protein AED:0.25 eAED:0.25 QI:0/-1/0/1/-1/1/1/0/368